MSGLYVSSATKNIDFYFLQILIAQKFVEIHMCLCVCI